MSLFGALNTAMSSITTLNTTTRVISDNIANANNENYNTRETKLNNNIHGGVNVANILRKVNDGIFKDFANSISSAKSNKAMDEIYRRIEELIGTSGNKTPLIDKVNALDLAWKSFEATPASDASEKGVIQAAMNLTTEMKRLSDGLDQIQSDIERNIVFSVKTLNKALSEFHELNTQITGNMVTNMPVANLENLRDEQVKIIAELIKVKQIENNDGSVYLHTTSGLSLAAPNPAVFTWDSASKSLTKSGNGSVNLVTDDSVTIGAIDSYTRLLRIDGDATSNPDATLAPIQKMKNQLDEFAFMLMDNSVARVTGNKFLKPNDNLVTDHGLSVGDRIAINVSGGIISTIIIGATTTVSDLLTDINAITNVSARVNSHGNLQILTNGEEMNVGDTNGTPLADLGFIIGNYKADNPPGISYAYDEEYVAGNTNLTGVSDLTTLAGITNGDSFNISVAGGAVTTVTINSGNSINNLLTTLNNIEGVRAKLDSDGFLNISTVQGKLNITNNNNTPLSSTGLGIAAVSGNIAVVNQAKANEENIGFFQVKNGTAIANASRLNIQVNENLLNGKNHIKDSAANKIVISMASSNRDISGSGMMSKNKNYTSIISSIVVDLTKKSENFDQLVKQENNIKDMLSKRLKNEAGVDIDEEVALLSVIQNSYSASARVIETINKMFDALSAATR